jgi:hypothetical protein
MQRVICLLLQVMSFFVYRWRRLPQLQCLSCSRLVLCILCLVFTCSLHVASAREYFIKLCNVYGAMGDMPLISGGRGHHSLWCGTGKVSVSAARAMFVLCSFLIYLTTLYRGAINVCETCSLWRTWIEDVWEQSSEERKYLNVKTIRPGM